MASPDILDFEQLLAPIPGDTPTGQELMEDKSASSTFFQVREAIKSAKDAEQRMKKKELMDRLEKTHEDRARSDPAFRETVEPPDWQRVYDLTTETLATKSKDLWIAAWLIDALTRLHGFAGLRDGFRLTRELAERYWDGIHPDPNNGNSERSVSQLTGLANGALSGPIAEIPITARTSVGRFRSTDYIDAKELEKISDEQQRNQQMELGTPSTAQIQEAVDETPASFFVHLVADIDQAMAEHTAMSQVLAERCGKNDDGLPIGPPPAKIRKSLEKCREYLSILAEDKLNEAEQELSVDEDVTVDDGDNADAPPRPKASAPGVIETREDAFRNLKQLASFFRKTEPLSPVSSALEQIVSWEDMSFSDLMTKLIANDDARKDLFRRTGIDSENDPGQ